MVATSFRNEMVDLVRRRHCVNHPLTEAWASGKLTREQLGLWAVEHYHYTSDLWRFIGRILANCDVAAGRAVELDNMADEENPEDVHNDQLTDFIAACGLDPQRAIQADPLPTTKALRDWLFLLCDRRTWQEAIAGFHVGMESQFNDICARVVPTLRDHYGFTPREMRFFATHVTADQEHGSRALDVVDRYTPEELRPKVLQAIWEGTEKRWGYFDGVYIKYVLGYNLGNQP
ncbi:MAG TPA: iron-containing redox enzyme family protein [Chloroflexota bacterium]|nr:iron-containing redox enzyme family protein [Chloroflexota bacterium]